MIYLQDCIEVGHLRRLNYDNAGIMLLAFDVGDYDTFYSIKNRWIEECQRYAQNAKLIIVGVQSGE